MTSSFQQPFQTVADLDGTPLTGGYVYFGAANTDPTVLANRIAIFFDAACTVSAPNPVRTSGGFIINGSSPANIYVAGTTDFSVAVHNRNNTPRYSIAAYPVRMLSANIAFGAIVVGTSIAPATAGGAFDGTVALPWSSSVSRAAQVRDLSVYGSTQPSTAPHLSRLTRRDMPLAECVYRVAPSLQNLFNVASVTVNGVGDYNVNLTVPAPAGIVVIGATADTPVRQAIADIDAGRTFIHVTTFNTNSGAAAASGFHLLARFDASASVADPIL